MVQSVISVVAKRMKLNSNLAKRKKDKDEPDESCEKDWGQEIYSNSSNVVWFTMVKERWPLLVMFRLV